MASILFVCALLLLLPGDAYTKHKKHSSSNIKKMTMSNGSERPTVGIISEIPPKVLPEQPNYNWAQSVIHADYVNFIEMAGARVVPIFLGRSDDYYLMHFRSVNGLVIQGDDINLQSDLYIKTVTNLLSQATAANDQNDYFPILAINGGFGVLANLLAEANVTTQCSALNVAVPLTMSSDYTNSRLFKNLPDDVNTSLTTQAVTYNYHEKCLTPDAVSGSKLKDVINILSTNVDFNKLEFVSTFETTKYPFYGLQWSPERNPFQWSLLQTNIPHGHDAVRVSQHMANFFVQEVVKSSHQFDDPHVEEMSVIYQQKQYYLTNVPNLDVKVMYVFKNTTT